MMHHSRKYGICLLLCCNLLSFAARAQHFDYNHDYERILLRTQDATDSLYYPALLKRFRTNDPGLTILQVLSLMIGYTGREDFHPYADLKTEQLIYRLNDSARYREVISVCDTFLQRHPMNQQAIIEKAYAFHQLKQPDSSQCYKQQFARIMAAMDWSADGGTPDHAMFAIGPKDGANFIDKYYHADVGYSGNAEDSQGNFCSMLEMKFKKEGKEQKRILYFVIQHAVNTTAKTQGPKAPVGNHQKKK